MIEATPKDQDRNLPYHHITRNTSTVKRRSLGGTQTDRSWAIPIITKSLLYLVASLIIQQRNHLCTFS